MNKPYVVRELWTRLLIPPATRRPCYAKEAWICEFADDLMPVESGQRGWGPIFAGCWNGLCFGCSKQCIGVALRSGEGATDGGGLTVGAADPKGGALTMNGSVRGPLARS
jgi:hypothetical protein